MNGTHVEVEACLPNVIVVQLLRGGAACERVFLPRLAVPGAGSR